MLLPQGIAEICRAAEMKLIRWLISAGQAADAATVSCTVGAFHTVACLLLAHCRGLFSVINMRHSQAGRQLKPLAARCRPLTYLDRAHSFYVSRWAVGGVYWVTWYATRALQADQTNNQPLATRGLDSNAERGSSLKLMNGSQVEFLARVFYILYDCVNIFYTLCTSIFRRIYINLIFLRPSDSIRFAIQIEISTF